MIPKLKAMVEIVGWDKLQVGVNQFQQLTRLQAVEDKQGSITSLFRTDFNTCIKQQLIIWT